jgi:hypothetical protein
LPHADPPKAIQAAREALNLATAPDCEYGARLTPRVLGRDRLRDIYEAVAAQPARESAGDFDLEYSFEDRAGRASSDLAHELWKRWARASKGTRVMRSPLRPIFGSIQGVQ